MLSNTSYGNGTFGPSGGALKDQALKVGPMLSSPSYGCSMLNSTALITKDLIIILEVAQVGPPLLRCTSYC